MWAKSQEFREASQNRGNEGGETKVFVELGWDKEELVCDFACLLVRQECPALKTCMIPCTMQLVTLNSTRNWGDLAS